MSKTKTRETSNESTNMSSFSNSGGEDGGDNIFDFDKDDDVASTMQSE